MNGKKADRVTDEADRVTDKVTDQTDDVPTNSVNESMTRMSRVTDQADGVTERTDDVPTDSVDESMTGMSRVTDETAKVTDRCCMNGDCCMEIWKRQKFEKSTFYIDL